MEYRESTDEWINPQVTVENIKKGKKGQTSEKEQLAIQNKIKKASSEYGVTTKDMISDGKGGYVPKEGATSYEGDTWDSKAGGWRDDAKEQYYSPEGKRISKQTADKLSIKQEAKLDKYKKREAKNKFIEETAEMAGLTSKKQPLLN